MRNIAFFVARFAIALVSQATSLANFTIYTNKMKTESLDIYSEEIKRNEVLDICLKKILSCVSFLVFFSFKCNESVKNLSSQIV